ncbi:MAG: HAMP domain-containing sensor histidine kinase [Lachnospiraceae bacterium]|nr:HAMP domain-containing sensor histidine kinase [Lachnospiraceae bacterium]
MEMIRTKKRKQSEVSIFRLFLEHLGGFLLAIIVLIVVVFIGTSFCMRTGILLQANYAEEMLSQTENSLKQHFDSSLLPLYSKYIVLDEDGDILDTDMSSKEIEKTKVYLSEGKKTYNIFYNTIIQDSGNRLIIKYDMLAHFANPSLTKIIPYPEITLTFLVLFLMIFFAMITAMRFSKRLKKNLVPIVTATDKIKNCDLDFEIEPTKIKEFNTSLTAIDQLKEALTDSLEKQWKSEQQKKSQLSALTHDIRTPLTVIKGNTELMQEDETTNENREFLSNIQISANTIEKYLELLMFVVNHNTLSITVVSIEVDLFVDELMSAIQPMCKIKNITIDLQNNVTSENFHIDKELMKRALINIVDNAIRYSEEKSMIHLQISENDIHFLFTITDQGRGFSPESLEKAVEEFYTEDTSRGSHHYGLGLNFANNVAQVHNGALSIENGLDGKGAQVSISIRK